MIAIGFGLLLVCAQTSCSATSTVQTGASGDTYSVSGRAEDSMGGLLIAQNQALEKAEHFCLDQGRRFAQTQDEATHDGDQSRYLVQFRCLASNDPRVQHPAVNRAPYEDERF
jgi:hypothetical protein